MKTIASCTNVSNRVDRFSLCTDYFRKHFKGGSVLEIGAGLGDLAQQMISAQVGITSYAVTDCCEDQVRILREKCLGDPFRTFLLDAANMPSGMAGLYDAVVMLHVIEHVVDPISVLRNIRSVLRPGGFLYIETPNIAKYSRRIKLMAGWFPATGGLREGILSYEGKPVTIMDGGHLHYFTYRSLAEVMKRYCGFSRTEKLSRFEDGNLLGLAASSLSARFIARSWPEMFSDVVLVAYV